MPERQGWTQAGMFGATLLIISFLFFVVMFLKGTGPYHNEQGTPIYYEHENDNLASEIRSLHQDVNLLQTQVAGLEKR